MYSCCVCLLGIYRGSDSLQYTSLLINTTLTSIICALNVRSTKRARPPSQILQIYNYCCCSQPQTRFNSNRNRVAGPGVWVMQKTPALSETEFGGVLSNPFCASDLSVPGGYADSSSRLSVTSIPRVISPVLSKRIF